MTVIYLNKQDFVENKERLRYMTTPEINECTEIEQLKERRRVLFCRLVSGFGTFYDLRELQNIVQRLFELGDPFYY